MASKDSPLNPVSLQGSRIRLRPIMEKDFPELLKWRNDPSDLMLWTEARTLVTSSVYAEELREEFKQGIYRLGIEENGSGQLIGNVFSYNHSLQNKHASVGLYICPEKRDLYFGVEAFLLFVRYFFAYFSPVKLYFDVFEFNTHSYQILKRAGFHIEGEFKKHLLFDGQYWSMTRFAGFREDLPRAEKYLERFRRHAVEP